MTGEIKHLYHVSETSGSSFFNMVKNALESGNFNGLYVEIQYSTAIQPDGHCVFSALIIGRAPEPTTKEAHNA